MSRRRTGNPTIADVARDCGVGTMTVSRVVNGGETVSPETAARVRAAIKKLGYEPNEAARVLKGQSSRTIGLIVPDLADPFFSTCAHAAQQMAAAHGYVTLLLATERDRTSESKALRLMNSRSVAAILIVPSDRSCIESLKHLQSQRVPVVMLDRTFPGLEAGEVMVENEGGAERAVKHLLDHGHRSILCVGYDSQFNSIEQRISGYEKAMTKAALRPQFCMVDDRTAIGAAVLKCLRSPKPPTALFTLNNVTTTQVLNVLQQENVNVPQEVALIGFDDFDLAPLLSVPLTAVRQPAAELGRSATRLVLNAIRSRNPAPHFIRERVLLPTELVIRRSCGCAPIPKIDAQRQGLKNFRS